MYLYKDTRWCGHCEADTLQYCRDSDHERDSSQDFQECSVCHWQYSGYSSKWHEPYVDVCPELVDTELEKEINYDRVEELCRRYIKKRLSGQEPSIFFLQEMAMWLPKVFNELKRLEG